MTNRQYPTISRMYWVIVAHKGSLCNSAAKVLLETDKSCQKQKKNIEKQLIFQQKNEKKSFIYSIFRCKVLVFRTYTNIFHFFMLFLNVSTHYL